MTIPSIFNAGTTLVPPPLAELVVFYRDNCGSEVRHSRPMTEKLMGAAFSMGALAQATMIGQVMEAEAKANATLDKHSEIDVHIYAEQSAREHARKAVDLLGGADSPDVPQYLKDSLKESWTPHTWVLEAIEQAYRDGKKERDAENEYLVQQMQEAHTLAENGMVRATVAAVMEEAMGALDNLTLSITLDKQRTIWDRLELTCSTDEPMTKVVWHLTSKAALPVEE